MASPPNPIPKEKKNKQKLVTYDHASERENWIEVKKKEAANPSDTLALAPSSSVKTQSSSHPQPDTTPQYHEDFPELSTTIQGGKQFPKSSSSTPRGKKQFRALDLGNSPVLSPWSVHGGPPAKDKQKLVSYEHAFERENWIELKKKEAANPSDSLALAPSSSVKTQALSQPQPDPTLQSHDDFPELSTTIQGGKQFPKSSSRTPRGKKQFRVLDLGNSPVQSPWSVHGGPSVEKKDKQKLVSYEHSSERDNWIELKKKEAANPSDSLALALSSRLKTQALSQPQPDPTLQSHDDFPELSTTIQGGKQFPKYSSSTPRGKKQFRALDLGNSSVQSPWSVHGGPSAEKKDKQKLVSYEHASERDNWIELKKKEAANPSDSLALAPSSSVKTQALSQPQPDPTLQSHDDFPELSTTIQGGKQFPKSSSSTPRGKKQFRALDLGNSPVQSPWSVHGGPSAEKKDKQKLVSYEHSSERDNWIELKKKEAANPSDSLALALSSRLKTQALSQPQPDPTLQSHDDFPELSTTIQGGKQFPKSSSSTPRGKNQFRALDLGNSPVQSPWSVHCGPSAEKKDKQKLVSYEHASERDNWIDLKKKEVANPSQLPLTCFLPSSSVKTQALSQPQPDPTVQSHDDFPELSTTIQGGKQFPKASSITPRGKKQFRALDLGNSPVQSPWSVHGGPSAEKKDKQKLVSHDLSSERDNWIELKKKEEKKNKQKLVTYDHSSERENWIEFKKKEAANPSDSPALALSSSVKTQALSQPQPDTTLQSHDDFPELSTTIQGGKQFPKSSSSTPRGKKQFRALDLGNSPVLSPWSVHGGPSAENKNKQKLVTYDNAAESDNLIEVKKKEAANPSVSLSLAPSSSVKTQSSSQPP